jgi:hypothetical protein
MAAEFVCLIMLFGNKTGNGKRGLIGMRGLTLFNEEDKRGERGVEVSLTEEMGKEETTIG